MSCRRARLYYIGKKRKLGNLEEESERKGLEFVISEWKMIRGGYRFVTSRRKCEGAT